MPVANTEANNNNSNNVLIRESILPSVNGALFVSKFQNQTKKPFTVPPMRVNRQQRAFSPPRANVASPMSGQQLLLMTPVQIQNTSDSAVSKPRKENLIKSHSLNNVKSEEKMHKNHYVMNNEVPSSETDLLVESCAKYLDENQAKSNPENINSDMADKPSVNKISRLNPLYGTLPKVIRKNISRSLVPKMRRMFERARSLEPPELPQVKINLHTDAKKKRSVSPNIKLFKASSLSSLSSTDKKSEETESVSSFVTLSKGATDISSSVCSDAENDFPAEKNRKRNSDGKEGFLNKYVKKVQNIMYVVGDSGVVANPSADKKDF